MNSLLQTMKDGGAVCGTFLEVPAPAIVEMMGYAGFDFVVIDTEHGPFEIDTAENLIRAASSTRIVPLVRVRENNPTLIGKALDAGARGVVVPQISGRENALAAVRAARYAPRGERGACPLVRAAQYTRWDWNDYSQAANDETLVILLIEGEEGIANVREIAAVPGVDVLFVGPFDLSQSVGVPGQIDHPLVQAKIDELVTAARARNIETGIFLTDPGQAPLLVRKGIRCLGYSADVKMMFDAFHGAVSTVKRAIGQPTSQA